MDAARRSCWRRRRRKGKQRRGARRRKRRRRRARPPLLKGKEVRDREKQRWRADVSAVALSSPPLFPLLCLLLSFYSSFSHLLSFPFSVSFLSFNALPPPELAHPRSPPLISSPSPLPRLGRSICPARARHEDSRLGRHRDGPGGQPGRALAAQPLGRPPRAAGRLVAACQGQR